MSAAAVMPSLAHAFIPPIVPVERNRDAATEAVLRYLEASGDEADAFDHLVAICWLATRPLFLADPQGSVIVRDIPQFSDLDGQRTGREDRHEGSVTREWIQEWLLGFLAPYRDRPRDEQVAAADKNRFRYLGRLCRLRLLDAIRSQPRMIHVSLDAARHLAAKPAAEDIIDCVSSLYRAVLANRTELRRLDVLHGLLAILGNVEQIGQRDYERLVTASVARRRQVSVQSARAYLRRFRITMARELGAANPAVRAVFLELFVRNADTATPAKTETRDAPADSRELTESFFKANGCAWDEPEP
jgi:hypothetical protein